MKLCLKSMVFLNDHCPTKKYKHKIDFLCFFFLIGEHIYVYILSGTYMDFFIKFYIWTLNFIYGLFYKIDFLCFFFNW